MSDIIQAIKRLAREVVIDEMTGIEPLIHKLIEEHEREYHASESEEHEQECHVPVGQALFDKVGKAIMEVESNRASKEHYDSEPCNLPVWDTPYQLEAAKGLIFTYWEFRDYIEGDWIVDNEKEIMRVNHGGMIKNPFWILHAIPLDESNLISLIVERL